MKHETGHVEIWAETLLLPTYGVGAADKNPMFLEKRVYQGSSGRVYPYPVIDRIEDEKKDMPYHAVVLENDYLRVTVLPELGGRIQRAVDKTNNYDFVYYNEVVKPALVGLLGPWISGGIEFNWPQHHRPTTYMPVDYTLRENADGSKSVLLSEVDQMYGTKGEARITLYPDKAYIEIEGRLYNRTNMPQTFLWWANPAVPVNDNTQSIFPPDVHAVFDHGKRDVSRFPIATGVYYKHDYGAGVDISRYKNIPVPTSYMCAGSDYDFVGGYDYGVEAGILHVADHHVSPGKKQWTWGCGDFGKAWDRNLTDRNGPYVELMTGVFTDNQPDFTWLAPMEEKTFHQYFMPYKKIGAVKSATKDLALGLECADGEVKVTLYAMGELHDAKAALSVNGKCVWNQLVSLQPTQTYEATIPVLAAANACCLTVTGADGREILSYQPAEEKVEKIPEPQAAIGAPESIRTAEELFLAGQHIEQYRHATFAPEDYYLEGLKRDPEDSRLNTAYGELLIRRGRFEDAERYLKTAIKRLTMHTPNPYDSEAYYLLGLSLRYQNCDEAAYDAFYKATWTNAQQEQSFYHLAAIDAARGRYADAYRHIERSLTKNTQNLKARALKGLLLIELDRKDEAAAWLRKNLAEEPFDYVSGILLAELEPETQTYERMHGRASSYLECALDLAEAGAFARAVSVLESCPQKTPMILYHEAYLKFRQSGTVDHALLEQARNCDSSYCFPNRLEDIAALRYAIEMEPQDARAPYYLGCLWYDKKQYQEAIALWECSAALDGAFPTVWRNLSLAYYNKNDRKEDALECMERAYRLNEGDARILLELDQLRAKLRTAPADRLELLRTHLDTVFLRDDLTVQYITLLNLAGKFGQAFEILSTRHFHPWEGGEGKVTKQYVICLLHFARTALADGNAEKAMELLQRARVYPENLGEGKLEGTTDNHILYYMGIAARKLGELEQAASYFTQSAAGNLTPAGVMYYNDQPADLILYQGLSYQALGKSEKAAACFHKLLNYGETHYYDTVKIDYFAVSLPDLQLFDEDLTVRNRAHCEYLIGLGELGLGHADKAREALKKVLTIDPAHEDAVRYLRLLAVEGNEQQ